MDERYSKNMQHRNRILRRVPITHDRLQKGMVIIGNYTPDSKEYKIKGWDVPKEYILLILNKNYEGYVHALNLDIFDIGTLDDLVEQYGLKYLYYGQKTIGVDIPTLKMELSSKRFYDRVLKKLVQEHPKAYRQMTITQFAYYQVVDYNFPEDQQRRFLYGLGIEENNPMTIDKFEYMELSDEQRRFLDEHKYKGLKYEGIPSNKKEYVEFDIEYNEKIISQLEGETQALLEDYYEDYEFGNRKTVYSGITNEERQLQNEIYDRQKHIDKQKNLLSNKNFMKNIKKKK